MSNVTEELLKESDAFLKGHFLLSSGKHSDGYVQCAKLLMYPEKAERVCQAIKKEIGENIPDLVVGPAMGGIIVSYELGRSLGVPAIFTERVDNVMMLRRGFEIKSGQRVIVVEDVVTTGKSSLETIKVLEEYGAEVIGIACIVDRRAEDLDLGYPVFAACKLDIKTYDKDDCPLCKKNIPAVKPGSRKIVQ